MLPVIDGWYGSFLDLLLAAVACSPAIQASDEVMPLINAQAASRLSPWMPLGMANAEPVASVIGSALLRLRGSMVMKFALGLTFSTPISQFSKIDIAVWPIRIGFCAEKKFCACANA